MTKLSISDVVREILTSEFNMPADEVIKLAKSRGLKASDNSVRNSIYNLRSLMKRNGHTAQPAAPKTATSKATKAVPSVATAAKQPTGQFDFASTLANVSLVNRVASQCGGIENSRKLADAVKACGGPESFLQLLEMLATIRSGE